MKDTELSLEEFENKIKTSKGKIFLKFTAPWCGPCKVFAPEVEKASNELIDVEFISVDIEKSPQIAQKMNVRAIPVSFILKDGKIEKQIIGPVGAKDLINTINAI